MKIVLILPLIFLAGCSTLGNISVEDIKKYGDKICTTYESLKDQFPSQTDESSEFQNQN